MKQELEKKISELDIDSNSKSLLLSNQIITLNDLWNQTRKNLKKMNLGDSAIKELEIKLQLLGLDFNRKDYGKN